MHDLFINQFKQICIFDTIQENFIDDPSIPWNAVEKGIDRKVMAYDKELMVVKVRFETDAIGSIHNHLNTQITFIESGVFEVTWIPRSNSPLKIALYSPLILGCHF